MQSTTQQYVQEIISVKKQIDALKARYKDLTYILLPDIEASGSVSIEGDTVYLYDSREAKRLDKDILRTVLSERLGAAVANEVIEQSSRISNASMPTVAVRLAKVPAVTNN